MPNAVDVANFFIDIANSEPDDFITNLRVNKLLYFAQAWSLVRLGKPLFNEQIQAWQYGPVVPSVYQTFKPCGREPIKSVFGNYSAEIFTDDELTLLIDIVREYGKYTSPALVDITHREGSPWAAVYYPNTNHEITQESMLEYYSKQNPLPSFDSSVINGEFVGYRDPIDGYLILPSELNDA